MFQLQRAIVILTFVCIPALASATSLQKDISQTVQPQTNFVWIDSLSRLAAKGLYSDILTTTPQLCCSPITVNVVGGHSSSWLFRTNLLHELRSQGLTISDSSSLMIDIGIADCAVRYNAHPTERDLLIRTLRVELRASYRSTAYQPIIRTYHDVVTRLSIRNLEQPSYDFTVSTLPAEATTWLDDALIPLVTVLAVATTVLLLFTVRSQ